MGKLLLAIVVITVHILVALIALNTFTEKKIVNKVSSIPVNLLNIDKNQFAISPSSKPVTKPKTTVTGTQATKKSLHELTTKPAIKTAQLTEFHKRNNKGDKSTNLNLKITEEITQEITAHADIAKSSVIKSNKRIAKYLYNPAPLYPRFARKRGYQGKVELNLLISQSGKVTDIKLLNSSGFKVLDKSAIKTVSQWLFVPTQLKDQAIDYWYQQNINFQLKEKGKVSNI